MGSKPSSDDLYHDKLSARLLSLIRAITFAGLLVRTKMLDLSLGGDY